MAENPHPPLGHKHSTLGSPKIVSTKLFASWEIDKTSSSCIPRWVYCRCLVVNVNVSVTVSVVLLGVRSLSIGFLEETSPSTHLIAMVHAGRDECSVGQMVKFTRQEHFFSFKSCNFAVMLVTQ